MGINDRDYYRDEEPGYLGSYRDHANACTWLIGICVVTFILQLITRENAAGIFLPGAFTQSLWLDVALIGKWQVWRLVSYAFLHSTDGVWHILFNMLALWFFGRQVEQRVGTREFVALYLCAAIFSALA
ncbi:MAG: rhomboid family intramembrane serine protease, partial [Planctomycetia bacterium]|nr:rhomboid family intramembrane serine protease [Planctomycetia bacterium]